MWLPESAGVVVSRDVSANSRVLHSLSSNLVFVFCVIVLPIVVLPSTESLSNSCSRNRRRGISQDQNETAVGFSLPAGIDQQPKDQRPIQNLGDAQACCFQHQAVVPCGQSVQQLLDSTDFLADPEAGVGWSLFTAMPTRCMSPVSDVTGMFHLKQGSFV